MPESEFLTVRSAEGRSAASPWTRLPTRCSYPQGTKVIVVSPAVRQQKGEHKKLLERIRKEGYNRVRVDGEIYNLSEDEIKLGENL